ncbi:MAG: hypothetical protein AAF089_11100 [Bacteroidota bacterium]
MASPARAVINLALYYVARPCARALPLRLLDGLGGVGLAPIALASAILASKRTRAYLELLGEAPSFSVVLRFTYLELRERWRAAYFFLDPKRESRPVEGDDEAKPGIMLTTLHAGMRYLGVWVKQREGNIVYIADPLEHAGGPNGAPPTCKWPYLTHDLHHQILRRHHVAPGGAFRKLAPTLSLGRPVFLCQDAVWLPDEGRAPTATLFGIPVCWPVGAHVLAARTGSPMLFTEVRYERGRWRLHQEGPLSFDNDEDVRRYVERRLRARPWAWSHWRVFMDELLEHRATRAEPRTLAVPGTA